MVRSSPLLAVMLFASFGLTSSACKDVSLPEGNAAEVSDEVLIQRLIAMGFRPDVIENRGDHFVVEGDILFKKSELIQPVDRTRRSPGGGPLFQWRTNNLVSHSGGTMTNIRVGVHANALPWDSAVWAAIAEWNAVTGSQIAFVSGAPVDITVMDGNLDDSTCAVANSPTPGGQPGATILTNPDHDTLSFADKKLLMAHEIAHTVGFRHTNWQGFEDENPLGATRIGSTPQTDAASVWNAGNCGTDWAGFSTNDEAAIRVLYNDLAWPTINQLGEEDYYARQLSWPAISGAEYYHIQVNGESCYYDYGTPFCTPFSYSLYTDIPEYIDGNYPGQGWSPPGRDCFATYRAFPVFSGGQGRLSQGGAGASWTCW